MQPSPSDSVSSSVQGGTRRRVWSWWFCGCGRKCGNFHFEEGLALQQCVLSRAWNKIPPTAHSLHWIHHPGWASCTSRSPFEISGFPKYDRPTQDISKVRLDNRQTCKSEFDVHEGIAGGRPARDRWKSEQQAWSRALDDWKGSRGQGRKGVRSQCHTSMVVLNGARGGIQGSKNESTAGEGSSIQWARRRKGLLSNLQSCRKTVR